MSPLDPSAVRAGSPYEAQRDAALSELMQRKEPRRVTLGDRLSLVFENGDTLRGALEETLRADRAAAAQAVATETAAFSALLPPEGSLAAVLYIDSDDAASLSDAAIELRGVESRLWLETERARIPAEPAPDTDLSAGAALVTFRLDPESRHEIRSAGEVTIAVDHPALQARAVLLDAQRQALLEGL